MREFAIENVDHTFKPLCLRRPLANLSVPAFIEPHSNIWGCSCLFCACWVEKRNYNIGGLTLIYWVFRHTRTHWGTNVKIENAQKIERIIQGRDQRIRRSWVTVSLCATRHRKTDLQIWEENRGIHARRTFGIQRAGAFSERNTRSASLLPTIVQIET